MNKYLLASLGLCGLFVLAGCGASGNVVTTQPLVITSAAPPSGTTGTAYANSGFPLSASGGTAPYYWSWAPASGSALPPGLTLSHGKISGTPSTPSTYKVVISVTDSQSPAAQKSSPYTITVAAGVLVIASSAPPSGTVGVSYANGGFSLMASGGVAPYTWSWTPATGSSLPPGLSLANAAITGTPTAAGTYNVVITVADSQTPTAQASNPYSIQVTAPNPLQITSSKPPNGTVALAYSRRAYSVLDSPCGHPYCYGFPLTASGGVGKYTWSWIGASGSSTPPGLHIAANHFQCPSPGYDDWQICGVPTTVGLYSIVITVKDSASPPHSVSQPYNIQIFQAPLTITTASLPVGAINLNFSFAFTATGGYPPYAWSETGALPPGLNLSTDGTLSGTSRATGTFPITVTVADSHSQNSPPTNFTVEIAAHGFKATGSMANVRESHTSTPLNDGRVLVAGGDVGGANTQIASAELYDPVTASFSVANNMITPRSDHTATLLSDGRVLVAGGYGIASAEVYDPTSGNFVGVGSMQADRHGATATLLKDGRVLVTGGMRNDGTVLATAELFDPSSNSFSPAGNMSIARFRHTATLLANGNVLLTGGLGSAATLSSAELYDPATGHFTTTGSMASTRVGHTSTALNNNLVVIIGGIDANNASVITAEIYNPATGTFSTTASLPVGFYFHTATLLANGQVLVAGGEIPSQSFTAVSTAVLFDPTAGRFSPSGAMTGPRVVHTATLLSDGTVLVVGGADRTQTQNQLLDTAELYQ